MTAQFSQAMEVRRLGLPVWWVVLTHETGRDGWPVSGDTIAKSFSKMPHSPRFPTTPFARVPRLDSKLSPKKPDWNF